MGWVAACDACAGACADACAGACAGVCATAEASRFSRSRCSRPET